MSALTGRRLPPPQHLRQQPLRAARRSRLSYGETSDSDDLSEPLTPTEEASTTAGLGRVDPRAESKDGSTLPSIEPPPSSSSAPSFAPSGSPLASQLAVSAPSHQSTSTSATTGTHELRPRREAATSTKRFGRRPTLSSKDEGARVYQCSGFGDCAMVFTRVEHLSRHIRSHTGEKPFLCHCSKTFSRVDNLRQHCATVHPGQKKLNESTIQALTKAHVELSTEAAGAFQQYVKSGEEARKLVRTKQDEKRKAAAVAKATGEEATAAGESESEDEGNVELVLSNAAPVPNPIAPPSLSQPVALTSKPKRKKPVPRVKQMLEPYVPPKSKVRTTQRGKPKSSAPSTSAPSTVAPFFNPTSRFAPGSRFTVGQNYSPVSRPGSTSRFSPSPYNFPATPAEHQTRHAIQICVGSASGSSMYSSPFPAYASYQRRQPLYYEEDPVTFFSNPSRKGLAGGSVPHPLSYESSASTGDVYQFEDQELSADQGFDGNDDRIRDHQPIPFYRPFLPRPPGPPVLPTVTRPYSPHSSRLAFSNAFASMQTMTEEERVSTDFSTSSARTRIATSLTMGAEREGGGGPASTGSVSQALTAVESSVGRRPSFENTFGGGHGRSLSSKSASSQSNGRVSPVKSATGATAELEPLMDLALGIRARSLALFEAQREEHSPPTAEASWVDLEQDNTNPQPAGSFPRTEADPFPSQYLLPSPFPSMCPSHISQQPSAPSFGTWRLPSPRTYDSTQVPGATSFSDSAHFRAYSSDDYHRIDMLAETTVLSEGLSSSHWADSRGPMLSALSPLPQSPALVMTSSAGTPQKPYPYSTAIGKRSRDENEDASDTSPPSKRLLYVFESDTRPVSRTVSRKGSVGCSFQPGFGSPLGLLDLNRLDSPLIDLQQPFAGTSSTSSPRRPLAPTASFSGKSASPARPARAPGLRISIPPASDYIDRVAFAAHRPLLPSNLSVIMGSNADDQT